MWLLRCSLAADLADVGIWGDILLKGTVF